MKVCVAEKPSVAKEIAMIIGANNRQDGYYEGNGYAVTWTYGHFCGLKHPHEYNEIWKKWSLGNLPILPEKFDTKVIGDKGVKKQFSVIKKLFKQAKVVINCGDAGQEGELIQRWVMNQAKYKGQVLRLWISSLTPEAIKDGFQNLRDASNYDNLYYAGSSRAIGDWLLGMNATRLYTLKYGGYKQLLSIGRVQTPTLAMLVKRFKEIENFVPKPFWELHTVYRDVDFHYEKGRFQKEEEGQDLLKKVEGHPFKILSFTKKKGKEYAPKLFDLTSLQVHCNRRFGYSADMTLKIVQKLYEQKVVTYPRVDTTYLPNDIYPKISGILQKMNNYQQFTQPLLAKPIPKSKRVFDDKKVTDHHAIIPTGYEKSLLMNEQNVYDAIARRFIGVFYPDCEVSNNVVIGEANEVKFKANGKEILVEGWRVVFKVAKPKTAASDKKPKANRDEKILPAFQVGETGPHAPKLVERMTKPPKHYTEATLLRAMETAGRQVDDGELRELMKENGIGRPSTRANIIETLFKRAYIYRQKKNIIATDMGVQLIDVIENEILKSAELTGQWEKQLRDIESGSYSAKDFIANMKKMVSDLTDEVSRKTGVKKLVNSAPEKKTRSRSNSNASSSRKAKSSSSGSKSTSKSKTAKASSLTECRCPKCRKGSLLKGKTAYGCSEWKGGCSFRLPYKFKGKKISENQLLRLIAKGSTVNLKGFKENGKSTAGNISFNDRYELILNAKGETASTNKTGTTAAKPKKKIPCPKCKTGQVVKGKTAYGCSNWKSGCAFRFSFEDIRSKAKGKPLTMDLVLSIISA